ncbi:MULTISPECIES: hypothetical protein [Pseudomonas syringae group]|uniref:Lipoprotein n=5 Tax=Pseudomonas syringae group TaxID=136849 RepID=A0AAE6QM87_9PSED|nr:MULTISPECIES: hypothetical protein [Pseudomonas syringae group]KGS13893.1 lipoprotein [Pseudomonas coronafaciens]KOP57682.1 lipoprotein [Pseudomonas coronafaciens pv. porri]KOP60580.1 lipoprotein [Pseudomonas coronafaciens pv. porri]KPB55704.1 Uncharacterized protein AC511_4415 [Pseudomonas coronafaciens pv. oryzae]KPX34580.1 Uncharacterized protein ALO77_00306 [Pseudomonas coronafaciens pv. garcae]
MKTLSKFAAVAALIATTSGCVSYNVSQPSVPLEGSVKTDLKADVKVGGTISGESSTNVLFNFLSFGGDSQFADGVTYGGSSGGGLGLSLPDPVSSAKAAAAYKAVKSSGADLIVAPRYEVSVQDYFIFKKVNVKVTGSKGSINSIR